MVQNRERNRSKLVTARNQRKSFEFIKLVVCEKKLTLSNSETLNLHGV